ncbi:hypothetical protein G4B88_017461 [Cannabis sativa]|uniref:Uncharacterized protein n=1 Tax=Cannabis sativa TaxID=3483 RepID=A0A7J6I4J9_CANSA|nr:hypothetical protein G4B88_017461 [Cannabis sativa]
MSYFVSLTKGYNLPMTVAPVGGRGGGRCKASGCVVELIKECPEELRVMYGDVGVGCNFSYPPQSRFRDTGKEVQVGNDSGAGIVWLRSEGTYNKASAPKSVQYFRPNYY